MQFYNGVSFPFGSTAFMLVLIHLFNVMILSIRRGFHPFGFEYDVVKAPLLMLPAGEPSRLVSRPHIDISAAGRPDRPSRVLVEHKLTEGFFGSSRRGGFGFDEGDA